MRKISRIMAAALCMLIAIGALASCRKQESTMTKADGGLSSGLLYRVYPDSRLNDMLQEPPVVVEIREDEEGYQTVYRVEEADQVKALSQLFAAVVVGEETDLFVTDSDNTLTFQWADGKETVLLLNGMNLEYRGEDGVHTYNLSYFTDFWNMGKTVGKVEAGEPDQTEEETTTEEETATEEETTEEETATEEKTTEKETTTEEKTTQEETTEEKTTTEEETTEEETTEAALNLRVVPSEASKIHYTRYDNGLFSAMVPEGWVVQPYEQSDYLHYTFKIYDPDEPRRMVYFNMKTEGYLNSRESWEWYRSLYPDSIFAQLPYIDNHTTEGFYNVFTAAMSLNNTDRFTFPVIRNFERIEKYGTNTTGGDIIRAHYVNENGDGVDGIFSASLYPVDLYYVTSFYVYDTFYVSAPENELPEWMEVLMTVFDSIEFSETFINNCYDEIAINVRTSAEIAKICSQMSDIVMSGWEAQQESYDRISQKQSDAVLGYERVYDTDTGEIYRAPVDFYDYYSGDRYVPVSDDQYLLPVDGYIEY